MAINRTQLAILVAQKANISKSRAQAVVDCIFDSMAEALLEGNRVEVREFGSFVVRDYKAYEGRNPRSGQKISVKEKKLPFFKAGKGLKVLDPK